MFIISVARGSSSTLSQSKTITGSLSADVELSSSEKEAVGAKFSLSASGSISQTYEKSTTYQFPSQYEGRYTTANYYSAVSFDKYNITVRKTNFYTTHSRTVPVPRDHEDKENITVYIPKIISYTRGANY